MAPDRRAARAGDAPSHDALITCAFCSSRLAGNVGQGLLFAGLFAVAGGGDAAAITLSGSVVAMMMGAVIFGLPGGALVDKVGPARGLALGSGLRMLGVLSALLLVGHGEWVWAVAFLYSAASQVFSPAELALVRVIRLPAPGRAHALLFILQHAGQGLGLIVLGPLLYVLGGAGAALGAALLMNVLVVLVALTIAIALGRRRPGYTLPVRRAFDLALTARFFAREATATYATGMLAFGEMASKAAVVAAPFYVKDELGLAGGQVALVAGPVAIGVAAALLWARSADCGRLSLSALRRVLLATVVGAVALAAAGGGPGPLAFANGLFDASMVNVAFAIPGLFLLSLSLTVSVVVGRAVLTATAPTDQQARVFAAQGVMTNVLAALPMLAAGVGTQLVGARMSVLGIGGLGVLVALVLESGALRRALASRAAPVERAAGVTNTSAVRRRVSPAASVSAPPS